MFKNKNCKITFGFEYIDKIEILLDQPFQVKSCLSVNLGFTGFL